MNPPIPSLSSPCFFSISSPCHCNSLLDLNHRTKRTLLSTIINDVTPALSPSLSLLPLLSLHPLILFLHFNANFFLNRSQDDEATIVNDMQILASSVRNLIGLVLQAEEGMKGEGEESKEPEYGGDDNDGEEGKEERDEQPAVRPLGGFEKFFGTCGTLGLGLIYFVADVSGPISTDMLARAMRMCVKRHPNLRSHLVPGYVFS